MKPAGAISFRPTPSVRPAKFLHRAFYARARKATFPNKVRDAETYARERWGDNVTELVLRAPSAPATVGDQGWAGLVAHDVVGDFVSSLAPPSAAAQLFAASPRVSLDGVHTMQFPARSGPIDPATVPWIAEDVPVPVIEQNVTRNVTLGPARKLMAITVLTRELAESSSAEAAFETMLRENAALALDATVFSALPATAARPAGALNGVAPLTTTPGGGDTATLLAIFRPVPPRSPRRPAGWRT